MNCTHYRSKNRDERTSAAGFTILELMVASSIFTVILVVIAVGVLSYTNSYYKGINSSKTQAATRAIMDTLVQSIQFGKKVTVLPSSGGASGLCIDNTLYTYVVGQQVVDTLPQSSLHQGYHGLVSSIGADCSSATPAQPPQILASGSRELLGQNMRVSDLSVTGGGRLYTIHLRVVYGDDDLLTTTSKWANAACVSGRPGSQFCAVSDLTTTVEQRLL